MGTLKKKKRWLGFAPCAITHHHTHFLTHLYLCVQTLYQHDTIPVLCAGKFNTLDVPSCMKNLFLTFHGSSSRREIFKKTLG